MDPLSLPEDASLSGESGRKKEERHLLAGKRGSRDPTDAPLQWKPIALLR
jgi:hypothetical protein